MGDPPRPPLFSRIFFDCVQSLFCISFFVGGWESWDTATTGPQRATSLPQDPPQKKLKKVQLPLTAAVTVALTVILNGNFCQNETRCTEIYYTLMK